VDQKPRAHVLEPIKVTFEAVEIELNVLDEVRDVGGFGGPILAVGDGAKIGNVVSEVLVQLGVQPKTKNKQQNENDPNRIRRGDTKQRYLHPPP